MSILIFACTMPALAFVLCYLLYVRCSGWGARGQLIWIVCLLLSLARFGAFQFFGYDYLFPDFPEPLIWLWGWAYSGALLLAFLSCFWWVKAGRRYLLPLVAWGLSAWGMWSGLKVPEIRNVDIVAPSLPAELDGYRIVQISDLHCSTAARAWRTQAVVDQVNALKPDLICLTGDYVDGRVLVCGDDLSPLDGLKARDGVYAITGNHEYSRTPGGWRTWYRKHQWRFLSNECVFPRAGLALGGVEDETTARGPGGRHADVCATFAAATNGEFRVLLEHRPGNARQNFEQAHVDLQLSGHTHGGLAPLLTVLVRAANDGFVRGLYSVGSSWLYVSSGAGQWSGFPVRLFVPSEITVLNLRKSK